MEHLATERQVTLAKTFDLATSSVRALNQFLHSELARSEVTHIEVLNPGGAHSIAVGMNHPVDIDVRGHGGITWAV